MINQNINLKELSTLNVGGNAEFYTEVSTKDELVEAVKYAQDNNLKITVLGSISNVIISDSGIKGLVIRLKNKNIEFLENNKVKAESGIIWDDFVAKTVEHGLYGVENLSYIPGTVGASAVQNIGAYGQEVAETVCYLTAYDLQTNKFLEITHQECKFEYRKSIFNTTDKGRYIIFDITYQLADNGKFSLQYKDMEYFRNDKDLSLEKVRNEIIKIRTNKLPDYDKIPNVGSFFKNPIICKEEFPAILEKANKINPDMAKKMQGFATSDDCVKIPAGLLIELCGLKGYKATNIGIYEKHALIVINHSKKGTCKDVLDFSDFVSNTLQEKLGISIEREPTVIS